MRRGKGHLDNVAGQLFRCWGGRPRRPTSSSTAFCLALPLSPRNSLMNSRTVTLAVEVLIAGDVRPHVALERRQVIPVRAGRLVRPRSPLVPSCVN